MGGRAMPCDTGIRRRKTSYVCHDACWGSIMEGKSQEYEKTIEDNKKPTVVSQEVSEMLIRITGTSQQLQAVLQYLKGLGLKYDVFVGQ